LFSQQRLRRFLGGRRLYSSPSANSGSIGGVFLRRVLVAAAISSVNCDCCIFLSIFVTAEAASLPPGISLFLLFFVSLSPLLRPLPSPPLARSLLAPPPSSTLPLGKLLGFSSSVSLALVSPRLTALSNLSRINLDLYFEPNKNHDTTIPRPLPTSQESARAYSCPKHSHSLPSADSLSPQQRLRRFLGERLSSSPSANSGSNDGVFLRGVLGCGVF
ncbi:unnamed protein product, partial [Musa acuminata var. zebrina]